MSRDLGRERSYTTTTYDFRSATWAGELAADIISGSESFPATAQLPCGPAMAAARGKSNGNWARHSWECGGAEEDGLSFFRSSPCCAIRRSPSDREEVYSQCVGLSRYRWMYWVQCAHPGQHSV